MRKLHNFKPLNPLGNQRGIALIMAIGLLAVMSVLAAMLLNTSMSEIQLSGNYRTQQEAFYAAERAIAYGTQRAANGDTDVNLYTGTDAAAPGAPLHRSRIDLPNVDAPLSGLDPNAANRVGFVNISAPRRGSGWSTSAQARNYLIAVTGKFPVAAANGSRISLQKQIAKMVPN